jgi:cysteine-rich repeat protein
MTGTVKTFAVLTGFIVQATTSAYELSIKLSVVRTSSTSNKVKVTSSSSISMWLDYFSYTEISINLGEITAIPGRVTIGTFSGTNGSSMSFPDVTGITRDYNTICGLQGFYLTGDKFISWDIGITPYTSIAASSNNSFCSFDFIYLIVEENWCNDTTPYLLQATNTCYDVCPARYYANPTGLSCEPCLYDCYECNNASKCSACNDTTDFRAMSSALRCTPITGYFESNTMVASACPLGCATCTSPTKCQTCTSSYVLNGTSCSISACSTTVPNCLNCSINGSSLDCVECELGYFLDLGNNTCSVVCGDGLLASSEGCDDGNTDNGDGCSSSCAVEPVFFCEGSIGNTSNCSQCSSNCLNCTSLASCTSCDTLYNITNGSCLPDCSSVADCIICQIANSSVQCLTCTWGFSVNGVNQCVTFCGDGVTAGNETCDDGNTTNGDGCSSLCQLEAAYFCEGTPSSCYPCFGYCLACSDNSSCTTCNTLAIYNSTAPACIVNCYYVNYCDNCTIGTINDSEGVQCEGCSPGFSLDLTNNLCLEVCGDGWVVGAEQCDDNNTDNGDGCSSSCTLEQAYYCIGQPSNCSYCLDYCISCVEATSCGVCSNLTIYDPLVPECYANCSVV